MHIIFPHKASNYRITKYSLSQEKGDGLLVTSNTVMHKVPFKFSPKELALPHEQEPWKMIKTVGRRDCICYFYNRFYPIVMCFHHKKNNLHFSFSSHITSLSLAMTTFWTHSGHKKDFNLFGVKCHWFVMSLVPGVKALCLSHSSSVRILVPESNIWPAGVFIPGKKIDLVTLDIPSVLLVLVFHTF